MKASRLPKNITSIRGTLYFDRKHKGVRYFVSLGLKDTAAQRKIAATKISLIVGYMQDGSFDPNNHPLLKKYHAKAEQTVSTLPTLAEYHTVVLDRERSRIKGSSIGTYETHYGQFRAALGDLRIDQITATNVEEWLVSMAKLPEAQRINPNPALQRLKQIITSARKEHGINVDLSLVKPVKSFKPKEEETNTYFTLEEVSTLYRACTPKMKVGILLTFFAGIRNGEMMGLYWTDLNMDRRKLSVRRNLTEGELLTPKTAKGVRTIDIHPMLYTSLVDWRKQNPNDTFVISTRTGGGYKDFAAWRRQFDDKCKALKLRDTLTWYSLRRSFATYRYACTDAVPKAIADDMGHEDVATTLNIYSQKVKHLEIKWNEVHLMENDAAVKEFRKIHGTAHAAPR
jgi:integrase